MKIWKLKKINGTKPWNPWYNKTNGIVILAYSAKNARKLAARNANDEGAIAWLNEAYSTCTQIPMDIEKIILTSEMWA